MDREPADLDDAAGGEPGPVRPSRVTLVVLLALLGVVCAAGITYAASRLVSQPIGLASEPRDLSGALTPPARTGPAATTTRTQATTTQATTTQATTTTTAAPPPPATTDGGDHGGGSPRRDSDGDYDD